MFELLKKCLKDIEPLILIERLRTHLKPNEVFENILSLQSSRLKELENRERQHTVAHDTFIAEKNKIRLSLSEFIDDLTESHFKANDKVFKTITEEDIEEAAGFIQGHINDLSCTYIHREKNNSGVKGDLDINTFNFKFSYSIGLGMIEFIQELKYRFQYYRANDPKNGANTVLVTFPFKELKLIELSEYNIDSPQYFIRNDVNTLYQINFKTRNRMKAITVYEFSSSDDTNQINEKTEDQQKLELETYENEYTLICKNKETAQRLVDAFKFLMKANGAKQEMF